MKNVVKQYSFIKKDTVSTKYSKWFKGVEDGFSNGSNGIKSMDLKVSRTKAVLRKESGEKPLIVWLKRFSLSERSWNLIRVVALPSLALEQRLFTGSLSKERFAMCHLSPLLIGFFPDMEELLKARQKEILIISLIHMLEPKRLETSIRQTLLDQDISEVQNDSLDFILFILWILQGIQPSQVSFLINKLSLCVDIWLKHGDLWEFPGYLKWITRCLPQVEDATLTVSPSLSVFTCSWKYIWYLSHGESLVEMHLLRVLMPSGKKGCSGDIIVLHLLSLEEPVNVFCIITTMRNLTGLLHKKNIAQDSPGYLKTVSGDLSGICQKDLTLINTSTLMVILIFLLQRERSLLLEKLILMVKLRSMALLISSGENLRGNMLLQPFLLIEKDWLLNKTRRLSSSSLSRLKVILLIRCFQLQRRRLNLVYDVMRFQSIKN